MNKTQEKFAYKLKQFILDNPGKVVMDYFGMDVQNDPERGKIVCDGVPAEALDCGTVGCIAGSACFLKTGRYTPDYGVPTSSEAQRLLGLTYAEGADLFYFPFHSTADGSTQRSRYKRYAKAIKGLEKGSPAYAKVVAAALQHCISFKVRQREKAVSK